MENTSPDSLQRICQLVIAHSNYWRVQKRHIEALNEGDAAAIVAIMAHNGTLPPAQLWAFRACLTRLSVQRPHLKNAASLNEYSDRVTAQQLWMLPSLASTLQTLHFENIRLSSMFSEVLMHLTSLTQLSVSAKKWKYPSRDALFISLENLLPLTSLKSLHLDRIHFGKEGRWTETTADSTMAPISQLTSLTALTLVLPGSYALQSVDYSPGVMHVGLLPQLQYFKCERCSCPPVCSSLTSLHWKVHYIDSKWACETARQVWVEWQSTLPRLKEFVFESDGDGNQDGGEQGFILPVLSQIISGAASTLTSLKFKGSYHSMPSDQVSIKGVHALQGLLSSHLGGCDYVSVEEVTSKLPALHHLQEIRVGRMRNIDSWKVGTMHVRRSRCERDESSCWEISWTPDDNGQRCTIRTPKFMTNRLLSRRQFVHAALPIQRIQDQDPEYLEALSPEVLQFDERFRYSREEMMSVRKEAEEHVKRDN